MAELGERMDASELMEWLAFEQIDLDASWYQSAALRLQLCRLAGDKKTKFDDLLPRRRKPRQPGSVATNIAAWASSCGAVFKPPGR